MGRSHWSNTAPTLTIKSTRAGAVKSIVYGRAKVFRRSE
jgi:hypothetical protein